jgi:hypothetical protein
MANKNDFLRRRASDGDNDGRGRFSFLVFIGGESVGFLWEYQAHVKGSEFFSNVLKREGGGDTVDNQLSHRRVQIDRGGTKYQMKEGGGPWVEGSGLYSLHVDESDIVEGVTLDILYKGGAKGRLNLVSEGDSGGEKRSSFMFDQELSFL